MRLKTFRRLLSGCGSTDSIKISSDRHKSRRYVAVALVKSKPGIIAVSIAPFVLGNYQLYYYLEKSTIIQTPEMRRKISKAQFMKYFLYSMDQYYRIKENSREYVNYRESRIRIKRLCERIVALLRYIIIKLGHDIICDSLCRTLT